MCIIHFETLGCKLNQIETESIARSFSDSGFAVSLEPVTAETETLSVQDGNTASAPFLCIVNTCTVTGKAEQKARRLIRLLLSLWPSSCVLVTGCYAEVDAAGVRSIDRRIFVVPGGRKDMLAGLPAYLVSRVPSLLSGSGGEADAVSVSEGLLALLSEWAAEEGNRGKSAARFTLATDNFRIHSRASLKIQDGCNNRCSYCRIRLARGGSVSLSVAETVERVRQIEKAGWREVVLAGVNLSQYRGARPDGSAADFPELLQILLAETGSAAFRISSLYPDLIDDRLCALLESARIRPHFHLSVQSLSDRVLAAMRRPYKAEAVKTAVARLRSVKENPFIAADIIAGFPGESAEDFETTYSACEELGFAWIHAFPFSPRPGTEAWDMKPKVPERTAKERVARLTALARKNREAYILQWAGKTVSAILEQRRAQVHCAEKRGASLRNAVTENYLHLGVSGVPEGLAAGQVIYVRPEIPLRGGLLMKEGSGADGKAVFVSVV